MINVTAASASELWVKTVRVLLAQGGRAAPRGLTTLEVVDAHLELTCPRRRLIAVPPARVINAAFAAAETVWILAGLDCDWIYTYNRRLTEFTDGNVLQGAYGPRLRAWPGTNGEQVDQLDQVRRELQADPATRRAVIQLFDPARDHQGHRDVPCTLGYWFIVRDGRLDMHSTMRSQDLWLGFCYDVFTATVLHELLAGWIGAELGSYHHHVGSLHLYAEHVPRAHDDLPATVAPGPTMPSLATGWEDLGPLLQEVIGGQPCGHPGWAEIGEVMRSYRVWKAGDRDDARTIADQANGPSPPP